MDPLPTDLEVVRAALTSPFGVAFLVLIVPPAWVLGSQAHNLVRVRAAIARRRHRYRTYRILAEALRDIRAGLPHGQVINLQTTTIPKETAQRLYDARPKDGNTWDHKVTLTHLLEKLDRLAVGVKMGVLDIAVWEGLSGHEITTLCSMLRNFVEISQEQRADRYASICELDQMFRHIDKERTARAAAGQRSTSPRLVHQ